MFGNLLVCCLALRTIVWVGQVIPVHGCREYDRKHYLSINEARRLAKNLIKRIPGSHALYGLACDAIQRMRITREFLRFRTRSQRERPTLVPKWGERQFSLGNRTAQTPFDRHYIYHTAWAIRQLQRHKPSEHVDISSSLYFVVLGSAVVPMRHFDYRPPLLTLENLTCAACDLMALPFPDNSIPSLSCMHVIEHIGLCDTVTRWIRWVILRVPES